MTSRRLLLALAVALGCAPLAFRSPVQADVRSAQSLTTIVGAHGLTRDTNGDGLDDAVAARVNMDLRLSKSFRVGMARAEFIAQLFNIFNRANFNAPNGNISAGNHTAGRPLFGQSTSLLPNINAPSRHAEFAVRIQF